MRDQLPLGMLTPSGSLDVSRAQDPDALREQIFFSLASITLVIFSGLCSGLTLGLLSLDKVDIEVVKRTGTSKQKWLAARVEPLLQNPHHLLVTLLLCNSLCMEALPLFLDRLLNPVAAILISVTAILLFGEVLPQAVCKRYGLHVGAYLSWLVRLLMWATLPISYPLGKLLDWLLGQESVLFRRAELRALVSLHAEPAASHAPSMLTAEEVTVIHGALDMANKTASTAMTPLEKVFMVGADDLVDRPFLQGLIQCGHSRIPVYDGGDERNIIGLILVKEMVLADLDAGLTVRQCRLRDIDHIVANTPLYSVLELFRFKRRHMAALTKGRPGGEPPWEDGVDHDQADGGASEQVHAPLLGAAGHSTAPEVVGIITIEDVIEELLQTEIVDETDVYVDNMQTEAVPPTPAVEGALPPQLTRWLSKGNWPKKKVLGRKPSGNTAAAVAAMAAARQVQRGGANSSKEMQFSDV